MRERRELISERRHVLLTDGSFRRKLAVDEVGERGLVGAGARAPDKIAMPPAVNRQEPGVRQRVGRRDGE